MARARLLKPDFFDDEKMTRLPLGARIFFASLWAQADREGRMEDRPEKLAAFAFPAMGNERMQAQARRDCPAWTDALLEAKCLVRYEVDGKAYLLIPSFPDHQKIHVNEPKSVLPPPMDPNDPQPPPIVTNVAGSRSRSRSRSGSRSGSGNKAEAEAEANTEAEAETADDPPAAHPFTVLYSSKHRERTKALIDGSRQGRCLSLEKEYGSEMCIQVAEEKGWDKHPNYYVEPLKERVNGKPTATPEPALVAEYAGIRSKYDD